MDKYYKWDGTTQGVEGLELFLGQKVQFNPESAQITFEYDAMKFCLNEGESVALLSEGGTMLVPADVNVDAAIAQYRASRDTKVAPPLNTDAPPPVDGPPCNVAPSFKEGTFEWALTQLARGNAVRCTAWKPGRVITQDEAANGTWELA